MDITYDYYRVFYYVAKYKSFTRAASILMNNQPNITRIISNLEKQLGCSLFIRSNRGVSLTYEGKKLYKHVAIAYEQLQSAELELSNSNNLESGSITISASETALHGILLSVLKEFHNSYPRIRIRLLNHCTPQAIQAVRNGLVDFAVVSTPTDVKKPLKEIRLKNFDEILACSSRYSFLSNRTHHLAELSGYPLICLGKDTSTYQFYTDFYLQHGLLMTPDIEVATADQLIPMITHDLGIGFVPKGFIQHNDNIFTIPLIEPIPPRFLCLVHDPSHPFSIAANKLKDMLKSSSSKEFNLSS